MSGQIERALQQVQAERAGEHLPLERILTVLHDEEYGDHLFLRDHGEVDFPIPGSAHDYYWRAQHNR